VAATRVSWYYIGQTIFPGTPSNAGMTYEYAYRLIRGDMTCGEALNDLKTDVSPGGETLWMNDLVFNVYGCPALGLSSTLPAPILNTEPAVTPGTENTVSWTAVNAAPASAMVESSTRSANNQSGKSLTSSIQSTTIQQQRNAPSATEMRLADVSATPVTALVADSIRSANNQSEKSFTSSIQSTTMPQQNNAPTATETHSAVNGRLLATDATSQRAVDQEVVGVTLPTSARFIPASDREYKVVKSEPAALASAIFSETFEGAFPGNSWNLYGSPTWDDVNYDKHGGSWSGWCGGSSLSPANGYVDNMNAWMVYGPFSLSGATGARVNFWYKNHSELNCDYFKWMASIDGNSFNGYQTSGDQSSWTSKTFDLSSVPTLGNLCGQNQVWIAFQFTSDYSVSGPTYKGAYVDDIVIEKDTTTLPDLTPYEPSNWNDKIPVEITQLSWDAAHSYTGPYYDNQTLYFNWGSLNQGAATASGYKVHVEVTGTGGGTWDWPSLTTPSTYWTHLMTDQGFGPLSAGTHTLKVWVDYDNTVGESNEGNNYYERTITVQPHVVEYYAECANNSGFNAPQNSGWIQPTSKTFTGLTPGLTYWYRVRARQGTQTSNWSNVESSTQEAPGVRESLDNMSLNIIRGGSANWFGCRIPSVRGNNAVQSGKISHGQESWMYTTLQGPGVFRFYWKVSSEANGDFLECYLDDIRQCFISGNVNWTKKVIAIPPGSHIVKWRYVKNSSISYGNDCGWVDYATYFSHATGLREGLDNLSLSITRGGQALWVGEKCPAVYGGDAGRSGWINDGQESWMQTTIDGPKILRFYWKVSSESDYDFLEYYLDEALQAEISGETAWAKQVLTIPSGRHTVKWRYVKDGSERRGQDSGWVDYVTIFNAPRGIESKSDIVNANHARMIPAAGDFDGDGLTDLAMVEAEGKWTVWLSGSGYGYPMVYALGIAGLPAVGDFDGDGLADMSMVDPDGKWMIWSSVSAYNMPLVYTLGKTGLPAAGDLDGDGLADLAIVDSEGNWTMWLSSKDAGQSKSSSLEIVGSPTMGDFDGDGLADLGLLDLHGGWTTWTSDAGYAMSPTRSLGVTGVPLTGDFDGDKLPDLLVYELSTGCFYGWFSGNRYLLDKMSPITMSSP